MHILDLDILRARKIAALSRAASKLMSNATHDLSSKGAPTVPLHNARYYIIVLPRFQQSATGTPPPPFHEPGKGQVTHIFGGR